MDRHEALVTAALVLLVVVAAGLVLRAARKRLKR